MAAQQNDKGQQMFDDVTTGQFKMDVEPSGMLLDIVNDIIQMSKPFYVPHGAPSSSQDMEVESRSLPDRLGGQQNYVVHSSVNHMTNDTMIHLNDTGGARRSYERPPNTGRGPTPSPLESESGSDYEYTRLRRRQGGHQTPPTYGHNVTYKTVYSRDTSRSHTHNEAAAITELQTKMDLLLDKVTGGRP